MNEIIDTKYKKLGLFYNCGTTCSTIAKRIVSQIENLIIKK